MIKMFRSVLLLFLLTQFGVQAQSEAREHSISATADLWYPYIYREQGVIQGYAHQIVDDVMARAGLPFELSIHPWARVYKKAQEGKNTLVVALGRTKARETRFHWIGPVAKPIDINFYRLRGNPIQIDSLEDIKHYRLGVVRGSYNEEFVRANGFIHSSVYTLSHPRQMLPMLMRNRLDVIISHDQNLHDLAHELGYDVSLFEKVFFAFSVAEYMAFSLDTDADIVTRAREAYQALASDGKIVLH